jgi:probable HAF family extracellular repeat protein
VKGQVLYTITDLGTLSGHNFSDALGINAAGQVAGTSSLNSDSNSRRAFRTTATGRVSDPGANLGTLGGAFSEGGAINASGQVTGLSRTAGDTATHAFRTTATGLVSDPGADLGTLPGFANSLGVGINDSGQVTGWSGVADFSVRHAFRTTATGRVSDPGSDLGTLGGTQSEGFAINTSGQVTGDAALPGNAATHAFRTTPTGLISDSGTDLGTLPGFPDSRGWGINTAGQVTGDSTVYDSNGRPIAGHAFRTTATGTLNDPGADLGTLGGNRSGGVGINAFGVVVGWSEFAVGSSDTHAFLFDGQMRDLNGLIPAGSGWLLTSASGINDLGLITGQGTIKGEMHAFRLTPVGVPEPSGLALAGLAVACACLARRRTSGRQPDV